MTQLPNDLFAVILAGGSGVRFWPLSRETWPKQMLQIVGEDTLLRQTIKRINGFVPPKNIWIVTTEDKAQDIKFHIEPLGPMTKEIQFIKEPLGRNTAPAIGLTAIYLHHLSPESVMIVMPSDHAISDTENFLSDLRLAIQGAMEDHLVTFGIKPSRPETGYGYIEVDHSSKTQVKGLAKVERFVEKPDLETAKNYIADGSYFWNSGIFVWKTSKILSEIQKHLPSLYRILKEIESLLFEPDRRDRPDKNFELSALSFKHSASQIPQSAIRNPQFSTLYATIEPVSIDYGIMERSTNTLMVPATFQWSDLGNWAALDEVIEKDNDGNILKGNTIDIGSQGSTIFAGERVIATIGLRDMVVVDTPDATLVTPKEKVQEVRKIVEVLKKNGREEHLLHKTVERPWGSYTVLEKGQGYKIKRVVLKPKARLSLQLHKRRSEHWVVVAGIAKVTRKDETYLVHTNESTYIPIKTRHRLENPADVPLQIIEVQNGEYLEENDIVRFDDDYGR
jgi:mannose-1-phosphate guanylyltransferase/mannose-6-phosphate isomerase